MSLRSPTNDIHDIGLGFLVSLSLLLTSVRTTKMSHLRPKCLLTFLLIVLQQGRILPDIYPPFCSLTIA